MDVSWLACALAAAGGSPGGCQSLGVSQVDGKHRGPSYRVQALVPQLVSLPWHVGSSLAGTRGRPNRGDFGDRSTWCLCPNTQHPLSVPLCQPGVTQCHPCIPPASPCPRNSSWQHVQGETGALGARSWAAFRGAFGPRWGWREGLCQEVEGHRALGSFRNGASSLGKGSPAPGAGSGCGWMRGSGLQEGGAEGAHPTSLGRGCLWGAGHPVGLVPTAGVLLAGGLPDPQSPSSSSFSFSAPVFPARWPVAYIMCSNPGIAPPVTQPPSQPRRGGGDPQLDAPLAPAITPPYLQRLAPGVICWGCVPIGEGDPIVTVTPPPLLCVLKNGFYYYYCYYLLLLFPSLRSGAGPRGCLCLLLTPYPEKQMAPRMRNVWGGCDCSPLHPRSLLKHVRASEGLAGQRVSKPCLLGLPAAPLAASEQLLVAPVAPRGWGEHGWGCRAGGSCKGAHHLDLLPLRSAQRGFAAIAWTCFSSFPSSLAWEWDHCAGPGVPWGWSPSWCDPLPVSSRPAGAGNGDCLASPGRPRGSGWGGFSHGVLGTGTKLLTLHRALLSGASPREADGSPLPAPLCGPRLSAGGTSPHPWLPHPYIPKLGRSPVA